MTDCIIPYSDAVAAVRDHMAGRTTPTLATHIKRILACRVADAVYGAGSGAEPRPHHEREAALHVRKMLAEGEISEQMNGKRLYYLIPTMEESR